MGSSLLFIITLVAIGFVGGSPPPALTEIGWGRSAQTYPGSTFKSAAAQPGFHKYVVRSLPDAPYTPRSWAGRIAIPETSKGNDIFFWLFEAEDKAYDENLIIWLNGGPGCSSMIGAFAENGPLAFVNDTNRLERNPFSWTKLGNVLYIDQPVGAGLSIASNPTPATDIKQITELFHKWLKQFYNEFPYLLQKRTHLIGESYGGIYVPYFAKKILEHKNELPLNLVSIGIGNGAIGHDIAMSDIAMGAYIKQHAGEIGISKEIVDAFSVADHICGFDSIQDEAVQFPSRGNFKIPSKLNNATGFDGNEECNIKPKDAAAVLSSILNATCYAQCATFSTARDHISTIRESRCFSMYNFNYDCHTWNPLIALTKYLNRADVQTALNLSPRVNGSTTSHFETCNQTMLDSLFAPAIQPVPPTESILPSILTDYKVPVHIFEGQLDLLLNHVAVELALQNMTWNGKHGFQSRPNTPFGTKANSTSQKSLAAGIWTHERGLTYHLFKNAGHGVSRDQPEEAWHYLKRLLAGEWSGLT